MNNDVIAEKLRQHAAELGKRDHFAHKGTYGRLLIIAGSRGMAGAAYLSGLAAFRTGIGMVKYFGCEANRVILQTLLPEAMYESYDAVDTGEASGIPVDALPAGKSENGGKETEAMHDDNGAAGHERILKKRLEDCLSWSDAVIIGPGLSKDYRAAALVRLIFDGEIRKKLNRQKIVVMDADALNIIADEGLSTGSITDAAGAPGKIVITPHIMEMARLVNSDALKALRDDMGRNTGPDDIKADAPYFAEAVGRHFHANVVLKDFATTVYTPGGGVTSIDAGCGAMAKAGSGDVLCGFIAGISAVFKWELEDSIPAAVYLHGKAGCIASENKGPHSILAKDIAESAGKAMENACADFAFF